MRKIAYILMVLLMAVGCRRAQAPSTVSVPKVYYKVPQAPAMLSGQEQVDDFYARNWWRIFDFADTAQATLSDTAYMVRLFADWATVLERVPREVGAECVKKVMDRASASKNTFGMFVAAAREILADPNSPLRDDELYMPVLHARIASPFTDDATRVRCRYRLDILSQNRLGHKANDIEYTLADGSKGSLYRIKADYTLVFINNPGCEMCRSVKEEICASDLLMGLILNGTIRILAIYPDEDLEEWNKYRGDMPANWINGYDKGCVMRSNGTYNLTAIPSLYLLDKDKTVLVKDAVSIPLIESALFRQSVSQ